MNKPIPAQTRLLLIDAHKQQHGNARRANDFADRLIQVWQSGAVNSLFPNIGYCADAMLAILKHSPGAPITARTLRLAAGHAPRFSANLRPRQ